MVMWMPGISALSTKLIFRLFGGYNAGTTTLWYATLCFSIGVVGEGVLFAWIRLRSGSLWPAVALHAAHNLLIQAVFDPMTKDTTVTRWITGEFGVYIAIVGVVLVVVFLPAGRRLESRSVGAARGPDGARGQGDHVQHRVDE